MMITSSQMDEMHRIQMDILRQVVSVCEQLQLRWFFVHGSLLGAVTTGKFMPLDDDIDIAMPRKDYEIFLAQGQQYMEPRYFIQSCKTDKAYPLAFAKVRDSETTYMAELLRKLDMNHGMFIDVFPLDFCEERRWKRKWNRLHSALLNTRISCAYAYPRRSMKTKLLQIVSLLACPSYQGALKRRERLNAAVKQGAFVAMTGGKPSEHRMPAQWFEKIKTADFEGVQVAVPSLYDKYLTQIYGNYKERTLLENKQHSADQVEINACIWDPETPYTNYM